MNDCKIFCADHHFAERSCKLSDKMGLITVKLFNLVLKDLAMDFLKRGIGIPGEALVPLLDDLTAGPDDPCALSRADDDHLDWPAMRHLYLDQKLVFVSAQCANTPDKHQPPATGGNTPNRSPAVKS